MVILSDWRLELDADQVLRGQGAVAESVRERRPALVGVAQRALEEGLPLLVPRVVAEERRVEAFRHERLRLDGGGQLSGALIAQHLRSAQRVVLAACTIGDALDTVIHRVMDEDPVFGLALDGLGSAAVEALAAAAASRFEAEAQAAGSQATIPLSPGMVGWPVEVGQAEIFSVLDGAQVGIALTPSAMMAPRKSISFVLGIGPDVRIEGRACDFCNLRDTCRYQDHYR